MPTSEDKMGWLNWFPIPTSEYVSAMKYWFLSREDIPFGSSVDDWFPPSRWISKSQSWVLDQERNACELRTQQQENFKEERESFCSLSGPFASGFVAPPMVPFASVQLHHLDLLHPFEIWTNTFSKLKQIHLENWFCCSLCISSITPASWPSVAPIWKKVQAPA